MSDRPALNSTIANAVPFDQILVSRDTYGDYLRSDVCRLLSQGYSIEDIVVYHHTVHWIAVYEKMKSREDIAGFHLEFHWYIEDFLLEETDFPGWHWIVSHFRDEQKYPPDDTLPLKRLCGRV